MEIETYWRDAKRKFRNANKYYLSEKAVDTIAVELNPFGQLKNNIFPYKPK